MAQNVTQYCHVCKSQTTSGPPVIQFEFARPHVSDGILIHSSTQGSSALKCLQSMRHRARNLLCSPSTLCRHIWFIVRWEIGHAFYVIGLKNISRFTRLHVIGFAADLFFSTLAPSARYRIRCGFVFFHSGERIYFLSGFAVEFAGYVRTLAVSGKIKLRIRKYPDTCGRNIEKAKLLNAFNCTCVFLMYLL